MADKDKQKKESLFRRLAKHLLKNKELSDDEKEVLAATDKYIDDEKENDKPITLKSVLGGDILTTAFFRNQLGLLIVIGICMMLYVANRYECQRLQIQISDLRQELKTLEFDAISVSSKLTEATRQSKIENILKKDTANTLRTAMSAPYKLKKEDFE